MNFHAPKATEDIVQQSMRKRGSATWGMEPNTDRLYDRIREKAATYKELVERRGVPYIVAVYGEITVDIEPDEVEECLTYPDSGLFALYPSLSGVVFFVERAGVYFFSYYSNPTATMPFEFPAGSLDLRVNL